jgi:hypothetical protein
MSEPEHFADITRRTFPALEEQIMSRSKSKGTAWETALCRFLAESGFPHVERRALAGTSDRGDIAGIPGWVIEAKNCRKVELAAWVDEAALEQANDGAEFSAVWHHRVGKAAPEAGYVTMTGATFVRLLHAAGHGSPSIESPADQNGSTRGLDGVAVSESALGPSEPETGAV